MENRNSERLTIDDVVRLSWIGDFTLSSKGWIAYTSVKPDLDSNRNNVELHVIADGKDLFYSVDSASSLSWSNDSSRLAFVGRRGVKREEKGSGIYVVTPGGDPRRVAWFKHGVQAVKWWGDDKGLAALVVETNKEYYDEDGDYVALDRLPLWFDGEGLIAGMKTQVYLVDPESGVSSRVTREDQGVQLYEPCGDYLYYVTPADWRNPLKGVLKRLKPGEEPEILVEGYSFGQLKCVEGELYVTAHKFEIGIASHYKLYRLVGGELACISCRVLDRNIWRVAGHINGEPLIVYADHGSSLVARLGEDGIRDLTGRGMIVYDASSNGESFIFTASTPTSPVELYSYNNGAIEKVTRLNQWLSRKARLYEPVKLSVEARGDTIEGWVIDPGGKGSKPLILYIHGGPKGMYGYGFHPEMQLAAAEGFIVAYANPRGSDGYSEEFADIRGRYGEVDYEQLMAFIDEVTKRFDVDTEKMAVTGISYGGYMTNVIVTKTSRFKAAVSENGIADWIADYWASDIGYWFDPDQIGGSPLDNLEEYIKKSPVFHASRVETPIMIIHSMEDYRCFIDQSLAMHTALVMNNKKSLLVVFTKGSHGHSVRAEPRHRKKRLQLKFAWLKKTLGIEGSEGEHAVSSS